MYIIYIVINIDNTFSQLFFGIMLIFNGFLWNKLNKELKLQACTEIMLSHKRHKS